MALAAKGKRVRVIQHNRKENVVEHGVEFYQFAHPDKFDPTHVVVLRAPQIVDQVQKQYPRARMAVWLHDLQVSDAAFADGLKKMNAAEAMIVGVSGWHQSQIVHCIQTLMSTAKNDKEAAQLHVRCKYIYNPLDSRADRDHPAWDECEKAPDPNKMVFMSSPHKGLARALEIVDRFKDFSELKNVRLYVFNPGYYTFDEKLQPMIDKLVSEGRVEIRGPTPWPQVFRHLLNTNIVFHPNNVFPETFGIVHAEANAAHVPFLTSQMNGASAEVSDHVAQLVDVSNNQTVLDTLALWTAKGRPKVRRMHRFGLGRVADAWVALLEAT